MTREIGAAALVIVASLVLTGCSTFPWDGQPDRYLPPAGAEFDYQLGTPYPPVDGIGVIVRDSTAEPATGLYNICYLNGFQTQPGQSATWLNQHAHLVLRDDAGDPVVDPEWPDEFLLDTSTSANQREISGILDDLMLECFEDGFDAVEFDNLDSWLRSDGALTFENNLGLARKLVFAAHGIGLAAAQKNAPEHSAEFREQAGFDFAITEECARYDECADYVSVYGDLVFDIEYSPDYLADACGAVGSAILRDLDLTAPGDPAYVLEGC